jgi:hypothetical protein
MQYLGRRNTHDVPDLFQILVFTRVHQAFDPSPYLPPHATRSARSAREPLGGRKWSVAVELFDEMLEFGEPRDPKSRGILGRSGLDLELVKYDESLRFMICLFSCLFLSLFMYLFIYIYFLLFIFLYANVYVYVYVYLLIINLGHS